MVSAERLRLDQADTGGVPWRRWGSYLSERRWARPARTTGAATPQRWRCCSRCSARRGCAGSWRACWMRRNSSGRTEYARRHGGTPSTGLTRTIDPHHFYPTIESAIAGFRQQTHAEWTAARPGHR
jgi:hypothetical protein